MLKLEAYQRLKQRIEELARQRDRAAGALETVMQTIRKEFGCKDLKSARKLLVKLDEQERELEAELQEAEAAFKEKWADTLEIP